MDEQRVVRANPVEFIRGLADTVLQTNIAQNVYTYHSMIKKTILL